MFEWQNFSTALAVLELAWIALAPVMKMKRAMTMMI